MEIKINDEELKEVAYKLTDLTPMVLLATGYLDGLALQHSQNEDWAVIYSLFNSKGMDNVRNTIELYTKQVDSLVDELLELAGEE